MLRGLVGLGLGLGLGLSLGLPRGLLGALWVGSPSLHPLGLRVGLGLGLGLGLPRSLLGALWVGSSPLQPPLARPRVLAHEVGHPTVRVLVHRLRKRLHGGYTAVTCRLHGGYTAVTWRLYGGYMAVHMKLFTQPTGSVSIGCESGYTAVTRQ